MKLTEPQHVGQKRPNRNLHLWAPHAEGYKCLICGGITKQPSVNETCDRYEKLTEEERVLGRAG